MHEPGKPASFRKGFDIPVKLSGIRFGGSFLRKCSSAH
jgi:hypothetical protein